MEQPHSSQKIIVGILALVLIILLLSLVWVNYKTNNQAPYIAPHALNT